MDTVHHHRQGKSKTICICELFWGHMLIPVLCNPQCTGCLSWLGWRWPTTTSIRRALRCTLPSSNFTATARRRSSWSIAAISWISGSSCSKCLLSITKRYRRRIQCDCERCREHKCYQRAITRSTASSRLSASTRSDASSRSAATRWSTVNATSSNWRHQKESIKN